MNLAQHWPFIIAALVVLGFLVHDFTRRPEAIEPPPRKYPEGAVDEEAKPRHSLEDGEPGSVPATDFLYDAAESGRPIRLNWTDDDTDPYGYAFTRDRGEWPTAVIPVVKDDWFTEPAP